MPDTHRIRGAIALIDAEITDGAIARVGVGQHVGAGCSSGERGHLAGVDQQQAVEIGVRADVRVIGANSGQRHAPGWIAAHFVQVVALLQIAVLQAGAQPPALRVGIGVLAVIQLDRGGVGAALLSAGQEIRLRVVGRVGVVRRVGQRDGGPRVAAQRIAKAQPRGRGCRKDVFAGVLHIAPGGTVEHQIHMALGIEPEAAAKLGVTQRAGLVETVGIHLRAALREPAAVVIGHRRIADAVDPLRAALLVVAVLEHAGAERKFQAVAIVVFQFAERAAALAYVVVAERAKPVWRDRQALGVQRRGEVLATAVGIVAVTVDGSVQRRRIAAEVVRRQHHAEVIVRPEGLAETALHLPGRRAALQLPAVFPIGHIGPHGGEAAVVIEGAARAQRSDAANGIAVHVGVEGFVDIHLLRQRGGNDVQRLHAPAGFGGRQRHAVDQHRVVVGIEATQAHELRFAAAVVDHHRDTGHALQRLAQAEVRDRADVIGRHAVGDHRRLALGANCLADGQVLAGDLHGIQLHRGGLAPGRGHHGFGGLRAQAGRDTQRQQTATGTRKGAET